MDTLSITREPETETLKPLGGRGLTSTILSREVPPNCDPLGRANKVVIAPGVLTGSSAPCSGRLSIGAKSPLTGGIKESNVGGTAGGLMAKMGIKAVIIQGKNTQKERFILEISNDDIKLIPAISIEKRNNYEAAKCLIDQNGPKTSYILVGPAGEAGLPLSTVAVSDMEGRPSRHAGRGGMGAVLASKGIKAVVISGKGRVRIPENSDSFQETRKAFAQDLVSTKGALTNFGTAVLVNVINEAGALPVRNFREGRFELVKNISGEVLADNCRTRGGKTGHGCHPGCMIKCSNIYHDKQNNYLTSALEYETIALLGCNCGLSDLDQIAELDFMCDNYGLDTMETGATLAVAMEGGLLEFGDFNAMKKMLTQIVQGSVTGRLLGQGALATGKTLGVERIPTVKGQAISAYDPRALKGTGTTYATTPMGGDHTAGNCLPGRTGLDDQTPQGQVFASKEIQVLTMLCDILGLCIFVGPVNDTLPTMTRLFNDFLGMNYSREEMLTLAENILLEEIRFNEKAGITKYQNDLPEFFRTEALPSNLVYDVDPEELINIYN